MDVTICSVCGHQEVTMLWPAVINADGVANPASKLYRCGYCGVGLTRPIPTPVDLAEQYSGGIYQTSGGRAFGVIDALLGAFGDSRLRTIARYKPNTGDLLDVGSGKGRFVKLAGMRRWNALGLELSAHQANNSHRRYGIPVIVGTIDQPPLKAESFDTITAWHVMEHATDPSAFVSAITRVLRPDGIFVCEVPNFASWQARIGGSLWFQLDVPRHITHLTPAALQTLLAEHNLTILAQRTFSPEIGLFGMLQTLSNRTGLPANILFRWLKRSTTDHSFVLRALLTATLLAFPALVLECAAALFGRGGVLQIVACHSDCFFANDDHGGCIR